MKEITLPFPPTVNTYWRKWNNRMVISEKGRAYRKAVAELMMLHGMQKHSKKLLQIEIRAYRPDNRKRDLDNLLKATLDSLANAGVYEDDSQIVDLRVYWSYEMGGMLKVRIEEMDG